jgi:7-carboxy-7-deazaguanine synthase
MEPSLTLSQIIPLTIEGEGKYIGEPTMFVRTTGCNLQCSGCDSAYSWQEESGTWEDYAISEIVNMFPVNSERLNISITGGEPLQHQNEKTFAEFVKICSDRFKRIIIETNGTIKPNEFLVFIDNIVFSVSPKLSAFVADKNKRFKQEVLKFLNYLDRSYFKFVIKDQQDIDEVMNDFQFISADKIYLMPEGATKEEILKSAPFVISQCIEHGFKFSDRQHLTYGVD